MFAKLFGPDDNQLLILATATPNGEPCINVSFEGDVVHDIRGYAVASVVYDTAEDRDRDFGNIQTEAQARATFKPFIDAFHEAKADSDRRLSH